MTKILNWEQYVNSEMDNFKSKILELGFILDENQVHVKGERSILLSKKLILTAIRTVDNLKVIIKISSQKEGIDEIIYERMCRVALQKMNFNYKKFNHPKEIHFENKNDNLIVITEFIGEEQNFLQRNTEEQFKIILKGLEILEGVHVTVNKLADFVTKFFEIKDFKIYEKKLLEYEKIILENWSGDNFKNILEKGKRMFMGSEYRVNQYCGFLTHFDFVPHNFRVRRENNEDKIYLLDYTSLSIGNKHESWARIINFMSLYNSDLERAILKYFELNRSEEELKSLKLLRIFRLFDHIHYYTKVYKNLENGNSLKELTKLRIFFWLELLKNVLDDKFLDPKVIEDYKNKRDSLRSKEELERQKVLY